jgi:hypothetical protein
VLFPTHLAAAALLGRVTRLSTVWLVTGATLPDLIDKPLGSLGVTTLFHSVGHSALLAVALLPVALMGRAGLAAAVGWASHLLLDALHVLVNGRPADALFLAWPVILPPDPLGIPPGAFFWHYLWSPSFYLELVVWAVLTVVLGRELLASRRHGPTDQPD